MGIKTRSEPAGGSSDEAAKRVAKALPLALGERNADGPRQLPWSRMAALTGAAPALPKSVSTG